MKRTAALFLILASCTAIKSQSFKVMEATSQRWAGGIRGSATGINYVITLVVKESSDKLKIDRLWVGESYFPVSASRRFPEPKNVYLKNDTVYLHATRRFPGERLPADPEYQEEQKDSIVPLPVPEPYKGYKGEALIGYTLNGQRMYMTIEKITQLPYIPYE